jgi:hypothetical protein
MGRTTYILLGIIVLALVCLLYNYSSLCKRDIGAVEGFQLTLEEENANRFNPLAAQTNPVKNPAVAIGVSEAKGRDLQDMFQAALNVGIQQADGAGSFKETPATNPISVRVDDENTFLGKVKMCKEKGVGANPFSDPAFAKDCGMCISSGSLITGETFTGPKGVLVYKADKEQAISEQKINGHKFPRVIPSLNSAQCVGASKSDSGLPVLALNKEDYEGYRKRSACKIGHAFSEECGLCVSTKEYSWVPKKGGIQPITIFLWGMGALTVKLAGRTVSNGNNLSMGTPLAIAIGRVAEGTSMEILVNKGATVEGPFVYGAITSPMANGGIYRLPIDRFLEKDTVSGSSIRKTEVKYFSDIKASCAKILPQPNKDSMNLQGNIPVTLVESDQLSAYDCPSSPFVMSEDNAQILVADPCLKKGQIPGNYSAECLRQTILEAFENPSSCTEEGEWYKNLSLDFGNKDRAQIRTMVQNQRKNMAKDPASRRGCTGEDISTPCDKGLTNECLVYLYKNRSENNPRIGRAYPSAPTSYTSSSANTSIQFCRKEGSLNPDKGDNPSGYLAAEAKLLEVSRGYRGQNGIEAVKLYLSDVFTNAIGNTDLKNDNWNKCFGIPIADKPPENVAKNSKNDVIRAVEAAAAEVCNSTPVQNTVRRAGGDPTYLTISGPGCVKKGEVFSVSAGGDWRQSASGAVWAQNDVANYGCRNPGCGFLAPRTAGKTTITYTMRGLQGKLDVKVQ